MLSRRASSSLWILNGVLLTQDPKRKVLRANIEIRGNRITSISRKTPRSTENVRFLDARGLTILPGFVQAHVHLCQTSFRNQADDMELMDWLSKKIWKLEAAHTAETLRTSALIGIQELLSSGTTCILDMGTVRHTEAIFEAVEKSGIRANVGKCLMDRASTTPQALREPTNQALQEAVALFHRWHGRAGDRIRVSYAPRFVISCTEDLLREVARIARAQGAIVHTHASENTKELQLVKKLVGCENVEYLHKLNLTSPQLVLAHCVWLKSREKNLLRKRGVHVVHCPSSNLKLASGIAPVPELRSRGINVALGADGAPCNNNLNMFTEMRLAALIHKPGFGPRAMRAQEVLDMATLSGARALGWIDDIGSIEVGKKADLIALDLKSISNWVPESKELDLRTLASSIVYSSNAANLRWTMVDGKILYKTSLRAGFNLTSRMRVDSN